MRRTRIPIDKLFEGNKHRGWTIAQFWEKAAL